MSAHQGTSSSEKSQHIVADALLDALAEVIIIVSFSEA